VDSASRIQSVGLGAQGSCLRDSAGLELGDASAVLELGVALVGGVFLEAEGVIAESGEPLVPLGLGGSES
jgi:hypothetical protein